MSADHQATLRARYLAEQQTQLTEDAKLPDPAKAYLALLREFRPRRADRPSGRIPAQRPSPIGW